MRAFIIFSILIFVAGCKLSFAQRENNIWYFGNKAGIDFNTGQPVVLTNSAMIQGEGCSVFSDGSGNLLFYTNGVNVWDKNHVIMPNGTGLFGHTSSSQSAIIAKKPGENKLYYIFTTDAIENNLARGLNYSIVDLDRNGGLGEVISKNKSLYLPVPEKVTAVRHENGIDIWIITHEWNSSSFRAYLLTSSGLNSIENSTPGFPVISTVGTYHGNVIWDAAGVIKASPSGNKIATSVYFTKFEMFDFDKNSGELSNPITIQTPISIRFYGIEFSPDESKVYLTKAVSPSYIYQYDLSSANAQLIASSNGPYEYGSMQLGPDGKIYVALKTSSYLSIIHNPNETGSSCNFVDKDIYLESGESILGLPYCVIGQTGIEFNFSNLCYGDTTEFYLSTSTGIDSVMWNFDDPASGSLNLSNDLNPIHIFTHQGTFNVSVIIYYPTGQDTLSNEVTLHPIPEINLGNDTYICNGGYIVLDAGPGFATYDWSNGSSDQWIVIDEPGTYWVSVTSPLGCPGSDTIKILDGIPLLINLGGEQGFCEGSSTILGVSGQYAQYLWSTGDTTSTIIVSDPGIYWLQVISEGNCESADTVTVYTNPNPYFESVHSPELGELVVEAAGGSPPYAYSLNNGDYQSDNYFTGLLPGSYSVYIKDMNGCTADTTTTIPEVPLVIPNFFTPNGDYIHDTWEIEGIQQYPDAKIMIYDRYGKLLVSYYGNETGWDGNYNGQPVVSDTYWYQITFQDGQPTIAGDVTIKR